MATCQRHQGWVQVGEPVAAVAEDPKVVALAGALCLGQYRGTIRASGAPLPTAMAVLDEQLPEWVERVRQQLGEG